MITMITDANTITDNTSIGQKQKREEDIIHIFRLTVVFSNSSIFREPSLV